MSSTGGGFGGIGNSFGRGPVPGAVAGTPGGFSPQTARLRLLDGAGAVQAEWPLDGLRLLVGRADPPLSAPQIDLGPYDNATPQAVSRRHAELLWQDGRLLLIELGSTNGTWLNGQRIPTPGLRQPGQPRELATGDRMRFGMLECQVIQS